MAKRSTTEDIPLQTLDLENAPRLDKRLIHLPMMQKNIFSDYQFDVEDYPESLRDKLSLQEEVQRGRLKLQQEKAREEKS